MRRVAVTGFKLALKVLHLPAGSDPITHALLPLFLYQTDRELHVKMHNY